MRKNLLLRLSELTDEDRKHIGWWLAASANVGATPPSWGMVALLDQETLKQLAESYFVKWNYLVEGPFKNSSSLPTYRKLFIKANAES